MIIVLASGWVLAGLLLALFVGGAVRAAEARGAWDAPGALHDAELTPAA